MNSNIQLLILPGLGGDHRMAYPQLALPYQCITPDYIPIEPDETIERYAARFNDYIMAKNTIDRSRPLFLAGYSFGSAIVQEMSRMLAPNGVILIGGLKSGRELNSFVRWFGLHIALRIPFIMYHMAGTILPPAMQQLSEISSMDIRLCQQMYLELPQGIFRTGYKLLAEWEGCPVTVPMLRIQGGNDHIISNISPAETMVRVKGAKHLVGFSHAEIVNKEIERFIDQVMSRLI
jgi:pimeloyl-ACP methyl ester carboxylesterase